MVKINNSALAVMVQGVWSFILQEAAFFNNMEGGVKSGGVHTSAQDRYRSE